MRTAIILMGLIALLLVTAVLPVFGGRSAEAVYYSPVFIFLNVLLGISCLICCRRRLNLRSAGFLLVHLGAIVILGGALTGFLSGVKGSLRLPVRTPSFFNTLFLQGKPGVPLGFNVAAEDFNVAFYPPSYQHYLPIPPGEVAPGEMPFEPDGLFDAGGPESWDLPGHGRFAVSNLQSRLTGEWVQHYPLPGGDVLIRLRQTPSFFGVTLLINDDESQLRIPIAINHPAQYRGWRFYLMSYDAHGREYVDLSVRRDPGRNAVIAGIWMLISGTFIVSFRRGKEVVNAHS